MKRLLCNLMILLTCGLSVQASSLPTDTLTVLQIAQEEGLSQLGASSLTFDDKGYLWVGTQDGLNRFNAYQMKVWQSNEETENFPNDFIRAMYYENDTLWMTTHTNALCAYLLAEDRFIHFSDQLDFKNNPSLKHSLALHATADNRFLLVGNSGHCLLFDRKTLRYKTLVIPQLLKHDFVTCIKPIDNNLYLIGTNASGLYILDCQKELIFTRDDLQDLQQEQINAIYPLNQHALLIGCSLGVYEWSPERQTLKLKIPDVIQSIYHWDDERLLMSGVHGNFFVNQDWEKQQLLFIDHSGKTMEATVMDVKEDEQGGKWLGTETRGILYYHPFQTKFHPKRINAPNSPQKEYISVFNFLREGETLWIATQFGLVRHHLKKNNYKLYPTAGVSYSLAKDEQGTLWASGFDQGLLRYNRHSDSFEQIPLPVTDHDVLQITPVTADSIWIHTLASGIFAVNIHNLHAQAVPLLGQAVLGARSGYIDRRKNRWIGSEDGLYQIKANGEVRHYNSLSNERVFSIAEDDRYIWIGTAKGLNRLNKQSEEIKQYTRQAGLPNDFIYGVEIDKNGNVWVSTNYGISMLNQEKQTFINYTEEDGLQNNEFNGKASYQDSLGNLYFGGMNGFNIFHPDSIPTNLHTGHTHIENVLLFGRPIARNILYTDSLTLPHNQNVISFEFSNLNYLWSKKNRYTFMLEGFDKEWRPVTDERTTTYTNLEPGTYTFKVQGSNNEFIWGDKDEMTIIISAPWYKTPAFRAAAMFFILLLVVGAFTYKQYQQGQTNLRLSQMVDERTEALSTMNKELEASLLLSQQQKDNISFLMQELNHRVKNNLQLITSLIDLQNFEIQHPHIQERLEALRSRIFTVSKVHDLLHVRDGEQGGSVKHFISKLTEELMIFSGQQITLHCEIADLLLPSNKLTYLGLILNELITNSIKHAFLEEQRDKQIDITLVEEEGHIRLIYRDNGVGMDQSKLHTTENKGIGLIKLLAEELKGQVLIAGKRGTQFQIILPIF